MVAQTKSGVFDPTPLIKELVAARNWSQAEFGRKIGITKTQVNHLFQGRQKWSATRLLGTSEALGIPISYFFGQGDEHDFLDDELKELLRTATPEDRELITETLRRILARN